jgi:hypothetical protein
LSWKDGDHAGETVHYENRRAGIPIRFAASTFAARLIFGFRLYRQFGGPRMDEIKEGKALPEEKQKPEQDVADVV